MIKVCVILLFCLCHSSLVVFAEPQSLDGELVPNPSSVSDEPKPADDAKRKEKKAKEEPAKTHVKGSSSFPASSSLQGTPRNEAEMKRDAIIQKLIEVTRCREMPERLIDSTFDNILSRQDGIANDVATALDEALLPGDMDLAERERVHDSMYKNPENLEQTKGYLNKLEIPKFVTVVFRHLLQENYTDAELEQLLAFWQSPVGRKTIELMPSMTENFVDLANQYFPPKLEDLQKQIIREADRPSPSKKKRNK
jgi:hypothetical protein